LEEAINGVEDMTYMTSTATNAGTVSITVYFKQGTVFIVAIVRTGEREHLQDTRLTFGSSHTDLRYFCRKLS